MGATTEQLVDRAAERLATPAERIELSDPVTLTPSACRLFEAWDVESLNPVPLPLADLPDGTIIAGIEDDGAETILRTCFLDTHTLPTTESMMAIVLAFSPTGGPMQVADPAQAQQALDGTSVTYHDPRRDEGPEGLTVTFFAENYERHRFVTVEATLTSDGTLDVTHQTH